MGFLDEEGLSLLTGLQKEALEQVLLDYCHPIGSIYLSDDPTDPSELFGGTWSPLEECYLRIGEPGTGGSDTVTLVLNNLPSHSHGMAHTHTMAHTHPGPSHTHTGPSHTHGVGTLATASSGNHSHMQIWTAAPNASHPSTGKYDIIYDQWTDGRTFNAIATASAGAHVHSITGSTAAAGTGNTGASGTGNTGAASNATTSKASVETTGLTGNADPVTIEPRYRSTHGWVRTA